MPIQHFKAYPVLVKLVTHGWAKGTPAEKPVGKLLEKLTSGTTHNTKVYQEQLEAFIAELKVQKAEAAVKKMTDPVDEGGCGGSVEGLLMHLSEKLVPGKASELSLSDVGLDNLIPLCMNPALCSGDAGLAQFTKLAGIVLLFDEFLDNGALGLTKDKKDVIAAAVGLSFEFGPNIANQPHVNSAAASEWFHVAEQIRGLLVVKATPEYSKEPIDLVLAVMREIEKHLPKKSNADKLVELEKMVGRDKREIGNGNKVLGEFRETGMYKHLLTEMRKHYALRVETDGKEVRAYVSAKTADELEGEVGE